MTNGTYVRLQIPVDEAFWRVVGLYLAEGHSARDGLRRRLSWAFHPTREGALVDEVASYWRRLGVKSDVRRLATTTTVVVSSRLLAGFWVEHLGLGADCYSHRIPDLIWSCPEAHKRALLSGLWHGDGSWSLVCGGPSIVLEYGTVSRALADGMLRLLGDLGIVARQKVARTAKSTVDTYWLIIAGADQVERVLELAKPEYRETIRSSIGRQAKRIAPTGYRRAPDGSTWVRVWERTSRTFDGYLYSLLVAGDTPVVMTGSLVVGTGPSPVASWRLPRHAAEGAGMLRSDGLQQQHMP